jgi:hypothetical protein
MTKSKIPLEAGELFILVILLLVAIPAFAQTMQTNPDSIPFAPAVNYGTGDAPHSVFCADLDGDTDLDLAVANWTSGNVSILKNNGDGTYQPKVNYGTANSPNSVFCADLDNDNDLDLAVANANSDNVSILKNNGDGTFGSAVNYGTASYPWSVFCADLDGDDDLDLAVTSYDAVSILKNKGDGTFDSAVSYGIGGTYRTSVFCGDLEGDGDLDLAVGCGSSPLRIVSVLKNNGDGTFDSLVNYDVGSYDFSVFCADLDGDSDLDLAVANIAGYNISILKNNGDGTFESAVNYGNLSRPYSVFCADLDGDSDLDLAVANVDGIATILKNNGDGTFGSAVNYRTGRRAASIFCADLDGDGDLDLAVPNDFDDNVSILENLSQAPANQPPYPFSLLSPTDGDSLSALLTLDWQTPSDPNLGDQIRYDLYVSTVSGFDPDSTAIYENLHISHLKAVLKSDTYYWKVKAYDNWGAIRWSSQTRSFYVLFLWGDASGDGRINSADVVYLINHLFAGGPAPLPLETGDANCDGTINSADVSYLINYLFVSGPPPGC